MKKALLVIVSMLVLAAVVVGCGSGQGGSQSAAGSQAGQAGQAASARTPESLPTAQGMQLVSDLEHVYFYYDHPSESIVYGEDGVYSADPNLENATLIFQNLGSDPLCLLGDKLYCNSSISVEAIDLKSNEIVEATPTRSGARSLAPYVTGDSSNGSSASMLYATYDDGLLLGDPGANGVLDSKPLDGVKDDVLRALTGEGVVYYSVLDDGYQVCSYDMQTATVNKIAEIATEWSFTVVGTDVYFFAEMDDENADSNGPRKWQLMHADAAGNVSPTGISGDVGGLLYSYGDFVFYTTYIEQAAEGDGADAGKSGKSAANGAGEEPLFLGRPSYYDTVTGGSAIIDRDAYAGMDIALRGVSSGYLYFDGHVIDELTGRESYNVYLDRLDGSGEMVNVDLLTRDAKPTDQVLAWNEIEAQRLEEIREKADAEYEEALKNEPYGPGTSKLYLKAEKDRSACYRLVRMDGSLEFQVLLAPGEKTTQSFPNGRYTLKIAQGEEWISDEEAFGESGEYDTTGIFTFEAGQSYEIGTGTGSSIRNDSLGGFTG